MYKITIPERENSKPYDGPRAGVTFSKGVALAESLTHGQVYGFARWGYKIERMGEGGKWKEVDATEELAALAGAETVDPVEEKKAPRAKTSQKPTGKGKGKGESEGEGEGDETE